MTELRALLSTTAYALRLPTDHRADIARYVRQHQRGGGAQIADDSPFRRQLDFWTLAVGVAAAEDARPLGGPSNAWSEKFVDTRAVQLSEHVVNILVILAASEYGLENPRVADPSEIIELANRYAGAGTPLLLRAFAAGGPLMPALKSVMGRLAETWSRSVTSVGIG